MDDGYADVTVKSKVWVLADFGQWLRRRGLSVTNVDEKLVEAFVKSITCNERQQVAVLRMISRTIGYWKMALSEVRSVGLVAMWAFGRG
jgi:site-specific recombinase XerD